MQIFQKEHLNLMCIILGLFVLSSGIKFQLFATAFFSEIC